MTTKVKLTKDEELRARLLKIFPEPSEFQEGALWERRRMLNIIEKEINIASAKGDYLSGVYLNRWRRHFIEGDHCHWISEYDAIVGFDVEELL